MIHPEMAKTAKLQQLVPHVQGRRDLPRSTKQPILTDVDNTSGTYEPEEIGGVSMGVRR